jgi:hypothetical protein
VILSLVLFCGAGYCPLWYPSFCYSCDTSWLGHLYCIINSACCDAFIQKVINSEGKWSIESDEGTTEQLLLINTPTFIFGKINKNQLEHCSGKGLLQSTVHKESCKEKTLKKFQIPVAEKNVCQAHCKKKTET